MRRAGLALLTLPIAAQAGSALNKVLLPADQYAGGKCMDGTPAGYYYGPPSSGSSTLWVIFLKGGGICRTKEDCDKWAAGLGGKKGGSTKWEEQMVVGGQLSSEAAENPDFHDAHHVYVPYCTGDTHSGQVSTPTEADHWGYYFDGHLNVKAIANHIYTTIAEAPQMQRVLFQGTSAGGRGVFFNCDFLQDYLTQLGATVSVKCNPRSGWFMPGNLQDGADPESPPTPWEYWSTGSLAPDVTPAYPHQTYLHPDCVAAAGADSSKCMSVHNMYQYIKAPVYAVQDMFDTNLAFVQAQLPEQDASSSMGQEYIAYIGNCTKSSMNQIVQHPKGKQGDGMFLTACFNHGSTAAIGGLKMDAGTGDWFFGRNTDSLLSKDTCDLAPPYLPCNPGCAGIPDVGACRAELQSLCSDAKTKSQYIDCVKDHVPELGAAGCTRDSVKAFRRVRPDGALVSGASSVLYPAMLALTAVSWAVL